MSEQMKQPQNGKQTVQNPSQPGNMGNQKQPFLKRYGAFFLLLLAGVVAGLVLPDLGKAALNNVLGSFKEMLSVLPPIFILLGLLDVWVDRATMVKYTGKGSGFKGVLIAFLLGPFRQICDLIVGIGRIRFLQQSVFFDVIFVQDVGEHGIGDSEVATGRNSLCCVLAGGRSQ